MLSQTIPATKEFEYRLRILCELPVCAFGNDNMPNFLLVLTILIADYMQLSHNYLTSITMVLQYAHAFEKSFCLSVFTSS